MYKISVPIRNFNVNENNREEWLRELKRFDADRVFLAIDCYVLDEDKQKEVFDRLKENCSFFKKNGLEVGMWMWVFGVNAENDFVHMRTLEGKDHHSRICPSDENFINFSKEYMKKAAKCGVDLIMFDDDFNFGNLNTPPCCLCDRHIKMINEITGEKNDCATLSSLIMNGGKNKYRDAYLKANGDAIRAYSRAIRQAVDEVNPKIRIGGCSCFTSWDIDGTDPTELSRILAGSTKPFYRLIGAPYWGVRSSFGVSLQDAVELERMESAWTKEDDVEIFAEGDAWPRPRYNCPASYLEGFDTAIRVSGCTDGILKYGLDYNSNPTYEKGYALFHEHNRDLYKGIHKIFSDKKHCGVRVYESMKKVADMEMETVINKDADIQAMFFSKAARVLSHNTIPSTYEGEGVCGIVFDENARALPLSALKNGLMIDMSAAEILMNRGIDVGIKRIGTRVSGSAERNLITNNIINHCFTPVTVFDNEFDDKIKILSVLKTEKGEIPLTYLYENANGNRFLVFNVNSRPNAEGKYKNTRFGTENVFRNYERSRQIAEFVEYCSGKKLPAYVYGCPELYIQCKESEGKLAVGLWNFFADEAIKPMVELSESYSKITFLNCHGELLGDKVRIDSIPAFGYVFFEVEK